MTVTAWDMGDVKNSANLSVIVHVSDVNDNVPVFTTPAEFNHTVAATIRSSDVIIKIRVSFTLDALVWRFYQQWFIRLWTLMMGSSPRFHIQ